MHDEISLILNDRESGSIALLNRLITELEHELHAKDLNAWAFNHLLINIREKLNHFAAMENFLASLISHAGHEDSFPGEAIRFIKDYRLQIQACLIDDSKLKEALVDTDLILMGCDALLPTEFLNKLGTRNILELAKQSNIRSFLVTESRKTITNSEWKKGLTNLVLFEWVPLDLVDRLVTEE